MWFNHGWGSNTRWIMSSCLNVHPCGCTTAAHLLEESLVTHLMLPAACLQVGVAGLNLAVHHWPATILCIEGHQQNLNRVCSGYHHQLYCTQPCLFVSCFGVSLPFQGLFCSLVCQTPALGQGRCFLRCPNLTTS